MIKEAIEKIVEMSRPSIVEVDERKYSTVNLLPVKGPGIEPLVIHTLTGLTDYLKEGIDDIDKNGVFIHVVGPGLVNLNSKLKGPFVERDTLVSATHEFKFGAFGKYFDLEEFNLLLQAQFQPNEDRDRLLKFTGNVVGSSVAVWADDGVTQSVEARKTVSTVDDVVVPNPVSLIPFRTFPECKQPESQFVFRLKGGASGEPPRCGLFEADGGQWENEAIITIGKWLKAQDLGVTIVS